jgi:transposase
MRVANRLHADLVARRPGYQDQVKNLAHVGSLRAAEELIQAETSVAAALAGRRLETLRRLTTEIAQVSRLIEEAVQQTGTGLMSIVGVGPLVAGWILAEVGDVRRFSSASQFAAANGTGAGPGRLGACAASSAQSRRQPSAESSAPHDRAHPGASRSEGESIH